MKKLARYTDTEEYKNLVDDLVAGTVEFRKIQADEVLKYKYFVAETITNHPSYQKFGKGNAEFIARLINDVNQQLSREESRIGKSSIYDLLALYEKFPDKEKAVVEITRKGLSPYRWRSYLSLIGRGEDSNALDLTCPPHICKFCKKEI